MTWTGSSLPWINIFDMGGVNNGVGEAPFPSFPQMSNCTEFAPSVPLPGIASQGKCRGCSATGGKCKGVGALLLSENGEQGGQTYTDEHCAKKEQDDPSHNAHNHP